MRPGNAIVVRRTQSLGGYRDGDRGDALVLEQIGQGPARTQLAGAVAVALAMLGAVSAQFFGGVLWLAGLIVGAVVGGLLGDVLGRLLRARSVPKVRLVVADRELRVFVPGDAPQPTSRVAVADLVRIELGPMNIEGEGWSLVAQRADGVQIPMLETGDRTAGLRVRTLILDRLVRDGAFEGQELASTPCPSCKARIIAPQRWLPTSVACGQCGAEGTLTHAG